MQIMCLVPTAAHLNATVLQLCLVVVKRAGRPCVLIHELREVEWVNVTDTCDVSEMHNVLVLQAWSQCLSPHSPVGVLRGASDHPFISVKPNSPSSEFAASPDTDEKAMLLDFALLSRATNMAESKQLMQLQLQHGFVPS